MKKTFALILAVLFVAMSFSGCGTGPNLGFTHEEFEQMLQQRIDESNYNLKLSYWDYFVSVKGLVVILVVIYVMDPLFFLLH